MPYDIEQGRNIQDLQQISTTIQRMQRDVCFIALGIVLLIIQLGFVGNTIAAAIKKAA